jgi:hypothetical protein
MTDIYIGIRLLAIVGTRIHVSVVGQAAGNFIASLAVDEVDTIRMRPDGTRRRLARWRVKPRRGHWRTIP